MNILRLHAYWCWLFTAAVAYSGSALSWESPSQWIPGRTYRSARERELKQQKRNLPHNVYPIAPLVEVGAPPAAPLLNPNRDMEPITIAAGVRRRAMAMA
jgi:hypothetical protein